METLSRTSSRMAHLKVDKPSHKEIILKTLKKMDNTLSSYGISKYCELSYYQIEKRMSELLREELIEQVCIVRIQTGQIELVTD